MAEWSTWWAHSWYSGARWFSAQHYGDQSQSRDWTTSSSQPRSLTLAQTSTPTSFRTAAPQLLLKLFVSTHTSGLTLDATTQTTQPCPTQPQDATSLAAPHSASSTDASTQLPLTEVFLGCIYSKDALDRVVPLPTNGNVSGASLPKPSNIATMNSLSSKSSNGGPIPVLCTQRDCTPLPPAGLEAQALLGTSHHIPSKAAPARRSSSHGPCLSPPGTQSSSQSPPALQPTVSTTQVGPHPSLFAEAPERGASTALARTHLGISTEARAGRGPFPKPMPIIIPIVRFGLPKPPAHGYFHNADSDLMHQQYRLSMLQWNPSPARRNPTNIIAATCGRFHAVILQEASDHVSQVSDQFIPYTGDTDLAIVLNRDTFEPNDAVFAFHEASISKDTWGHGSPCGPRTFKTPFSFRFTHSQVLLCSPPQSRGQETRCIRWFASTTTRAHDSAQR